VLTWFLDRWGVESSLAQDLVGEAIGGRFESWTHPDPALVDDVAERLTGSIPRAADARESTVQPDDLQRWLEVRDQVPWKPARSRSGAEGGRERYGIGPETPDQFNACLPQSEFDPNHPLSVSVRAACVYLDVCFFHPSTTVTPGRLSSRRCSSSRVRESCWKTLGHSAGSAFMLLTPRTRVAGP
jgi:hypothetical protein